MIIILQSKLLAEKNNVRIVVTQQWRYLRGQRTMKRLIAERFVGKPQVGHMVSYKSRNGEYPDSSHSQLWQMTVHEIDSLTSIITFEFFTFFLAK